MRNIFFLLFFFIILLPITAQAQSSLDIPTQQSLEVTIEPKFPKPGESVNASVNIYGPTLREDSIVWTLNGIEISRGQKNVTFDVGEVGSRNILQVRSATTNNPVLSKTVEIIPAYVDLFYNADTETTPFYKGKALVTKDSTYSVNAISYVTNSSGQRLNPSSLRFEWRVNGSLIPNASGIGRNTFLNQSGILSTSNNISVKVSPANGFGAIATGSIQIPITEPRILLLEENSLYGTLYHNIPKREFRLEGNEVTLKATPYFFPKGSGIDLSWQIGGNSVSEDLIKNQSVVFRNDSNSTGQSNVSVKASSILGSPQNASTGLNLIFGQ